MIIKWVPGMRMVPEPAEGFEFGHSGTEWWGTSCVPNSGEVWGVTVKFIVPELRELLIYLKAWLVVKHTMIRRATLCWVDSPPYSRSMGKRQQGQPHRGSHARVTAVTASACDEFPG